MGLAHSLIAQGKGAEAIAEAKKATEADPNSGAAFAAHGLAILAENKANAAAALNEAGQASFLAPRNAAVQVAVGRIFEQAGNLDQAVTAFRKATEVDPDYVPARVSLVQGLIYRGKTDEAIPRRRSWPTDTPTTARRSSSTAACCCRKGEFVAAVQPLEKAAQTLPGSAEAHAFLGTAQQYTGNSAGALEAYRKAVTLAPNNVSYRSTFGLLLGIADKYDEAVKELTKVVNSPGYKDTAGWTNLGWVYRNMEPTSKPEEAIKAYAKALELDPKNEPGGARPGLGLLLQPQVRRGHQLLPEGHLARAQDGRGGQQRHRLVLLLQERPGEGQGVRRQGQGRRTQRGRAARQHRQEGEGPRAGHGPGG